MHSKITLLTLSATLTLALSGCASVESRALPKCSGHDRRPLNADLWNWKEAKPGERVAHPAEALNFALTPSRSSSTKAIEHAVVLDDAPRWNIASSFQPCH